MKLLKRKKLGRKLLSRFLLTLAMVVGLMPGMGLTVRAATDTYTNLMNSKTVVHFNGYDWYIIEDESTTEGTVTLLSADTKFGTCKFFSSGNKNSYNDSDVKKYLDNIVAGTAGEGKPNFKDVASAIKEVTLTTNKYNSSEEYETTENAKLYLLSTTEANTLKQNNNLSDVLKINFSGGSCYGGEWWLRSPGSKANNAARVSGEYGTINPSGYTVTNEFGVRPALKLDLSKVTFDSDTNTFHEHSFTYALSSDGKTIMATCSADGCPLPPSSEGGTDHVATLTIGAPAHTNVGDGKSAEATITDANSIKGSATVVYKKGDETLGSAPTDAGDYTAEITLTGVKTSEGDDKSVTASVAYTIAKATPTTPTDLTATYGQTLGNVTLPTGWTWVDSTQSVGNAGNNTFKANFTPTDTNYIAKNNVDVTVTVSKANAVPATVTANNRTYDGTEKSLVTVTGEPMGGTMYYALGENSTTAPADNLYTTSIPAKTEAGTYFIWYKVVGDENHNGTEPACVEVTIKEKAEEPEKESEKQTEAPSPTPPAPTPASSYTPPVDQNPVSASPETTPTPALTTNSTHDTFTGVTETITQSTNGTAAVTNVESTNPSTLRLTGMVNHNGKDYSVSSFATNSFQNVVAYKIVIDLKKKEQTGEQSERVVFMPQTFNGSDAKVLSLKLDSSNQVGFKKGALDGSDIEKIVVYGLTKSEFNRVKQKLRAAGYKGKVVWKKPK